MIIPDHYSTTRTPLQGYKQKAATQPSMLHRSNLFVEQWMKIINIKPIGVTCYFKPVIFSGNLCLAGQVTGYKTAPYMQGRR
jgi:hypothetical protein